MSGSLSRGLTAHLRADAPSDAVRAGAFVVVEDGGDTYFSLVSDLELGARDQALLALDARPGSVTEEALRAGGLFVAATLKPSLVLRGAAGSIEPVRTIPRHFASVSIADAADYARVFGDPAEAGSFAVGRPLGADVDVPINLARFVERSSGIFGRSGTGKSTLTRLLLAGVIRADAASALVFDMHNEYGDGTPHGHAQRGLRSLFPGRVQVFTLDPASSKRRGARVDGTLTIAWEDIDETDLELLTEEIGLAPGALNNAPALQRRFGPAWLQSFLELSSADITGLADGLQLNASSLMSFHRKLQKSLARLPFLGKDSSTNAIIDALLGGQSVVLEFGTYDSLLAYALVANVVTRAVRATYQHRCEEAAGDEARRPKPLLITVEEAHKFLDPAAAKLTTFGTIAREMRKYNVTLLVVDQRPSSIDAEVLSQLGTRVVASITDERDLDAVLAGLPDPSKLRGVLASLDPQRQVLLIGHALPMPIVVRTRAYDATFFEEIAERGALKALAAKAPSARAARATPAGQTKETGPDQAAIDALFGQR